MAQQEFGRESDLVSHPGAGVRSTELKARANFRLSSRPLPDKKAPKEALKEDSLAGKADHARNRPVPAGATKARNL